MTPENEVLVQVLATVFSVLGSIWWLDRKITGARLELQDNINSLDTKLTGEVKEVRQASESAHKEILAQLSDVRVQQAAQSERLKCIESRLDMTGTDE